MDLGSRQKIIYQTGDQNVRTFKTICAQGDVLIRRVDALPDSLKKVDPENGRIIVTHSETGHHHVMDADSAELFQGPDLLTAFLLVRKACRLEHLRPHDTHEAIEFAPGVYEVRRQREYVPEGFRRVQD
jgi:hypothetical protein